MRFCLFVLTTCGISLIALSGAAQTRFDLSKQPAGHTTNQNAGTASNASLLKSASTRKPDSAMLRPKGINEGTYTGRGTNNDAQMMNTHSTQYKIGNTKATSTYYYDESGKIKGHNTTIGGK